jgi:hypothetical protein
MLIPSISIILVSLGILSTLMIANWLIWGSTLTRNFRMTAVDGPSDYPVVHDPDDGFKRVA